MLYSCNLQLGRVLNCNYCLVCQRCLRCACSHTKMKNKKIIMAIFNRRCHSGDLCIWNSLHSIFCFFCDHRENDVINHTNSQTNEFNFTIVCFTFRSTLWHAWIYFIHFFFFRSEIILFCRCRKRLKRLQTLASTRRCSIVIWHWNCQKIKCRPPTSGSMVPAKMYVAKIVLWISFRKT